MSNKEKKYLSIKDASYFLSLSRFTLHRLIKSGEIPSYKIGKKRLFDKDELIKWVKAHKDKGKQTKKGRR